MSDWLRGVAVEGSAHHSLNFGLIRSLLQSLLQFILRRDIGRVILVDLFMSKSARGFE